MTATTDAPTLAPPDDDPRVVRALEHYLAELEAGRTPDRAALLAEYADVAGPLADCLGGLELLRTAAVPDDPRRLGDFRLVREIGRGGMGIVHEAEQLSLGRRVAVKVLPAAGGGDLRRFRHEAKAAALLSHPNIVPVYAVGEANGTHFIAMRLIEGWSLADVLGGHRAANGSTVPLVGRTAEGDDAPPPEPPLAGPIPAVPGNPREAAGLALQAADALAHAHAAGVIHRDVKPANLLLDPAGRLWVADFGLAYLPGASRVTRSGALVGTLRYMSPEQLDPARGAADHRADLYALGATLYELLAGRPVVDAADHGAAVNAVLNQLPVPPRRLNPAVPVDLETVVLKCLAKDPGDRYPSAVALADDLRRFLAGQSVLARRPSPAERLARWAVRNHRAAAAAAGVLVAVFALQAINQLRLTGARDATAVERGEARAAVDDLFAQYTDRWLARGPGADARDREFLAKAQAHYDRLAATDGGTRADRLAAAVARRRVADIDARLGRPAEAGYADAADRLRRLVDDEPGWADATREMAVTAADLGLLLADAGRRDEAGRQYAAAADEFRRLAEAGDVRDRAGLAGVENNQGLLWAAAGRWPAAEACFRAARAHFARLATEFPDRPAFAAEAAGAAHNLAALLADAGRTGDAVPAYREALTLRRRAAESLPGSPAAAAELARSEEGLAEILTRRRELDEAGRLAAAALARRERLLAEAPAVPAYRCQLAGSLRVSAGWLAATGRGADAAAHLDRASELLRPLADGPAGAAELARVRQAAERVAAPAAPGGSP
jgi:hypothetical protein